MATTPDPILGGRYPKAVRWTGKLEAAGWEVVNQGENRRSIPRLDWEIEAVVRAVQAAEPGVLTVMLGSNDLLQRPNLTAEICGQRMERFLSALLAEAPVRWETAGKSSRTVTTGRVSVLLI